MARLCRAHREWFLAPAIAGGLVLIASLLGWRGGDLPAQIYRVGLFHRDGLTIWDSQWYGGHWTLDYSVLFPPVAGIIGIQATAMLSAVAAAAVFDRLVVGHFGRGARPGSLAFAAGTLVQASIGQLPFLMGEALAMGAIGAAVKGRWRLALVLALATSLTSPLAGAFLGLAVVSWMVAAWPRHRLGLVAVAGAAAAPVLAFAALFPGQGSFPFRLSGLILGIAVCVGASLLVPATEPALRTGARLYGIVLALSFALPSPLGGNAVRLAECLSIPLAACVLWPVRRVVLGVVAVPLAIAQWTPAWGAIVADGRDPSTHAAYYQPLIDFLGHNRQPPARVEVVPTKLHWEAAYVAPRQPLARGWERQLDIANNPLFYDQDLLTPTSYLAWLRDNGVRYVALPDAPLDYAGVGEAALLRTGLPGLRLALSTPHWSVFEVTDSPGIVSGPARLVRLDGGLVDLAATGAGTVVVRVRYSPNWSLNGAGCVHQAPGAWTAVESAGPGPLQLRVHLTGAAASACSP